KILEILAKFYYLEISEELLSFLGEDKILNLEKFFLKQLLFLAVRLYSKSLLSIGVVLGYLQMKEAEIINLRTLSFGLYHGLPTGLLKEQLILSYS
ncbi:MAG: V-type ATPase subunit, partial [Candidatus Omnitrophica bacterium]|nr:V-type ATPase subunit [Candidatus Omnitrophota bacterium]